MAAAFAIGLGAAALAAPAGAVDRPLLQIVPLGGTLHEDLAPPSYLDLDPTVGVIETFACNVFATDQHQGVDIGIKTFAEKRIGVPVFAAQDGVVTFVYDESFDEETTPPVPYVNNIVTIDHGAGRTTSYFHIATHSATNLGIQVGQPVVAGQQIGLAASAGFSFGPHLHLQTEDDGVPIEPFAGPCGPATSAWAVQPPLVTNTYVYDFGATTADLFDPANGPPNPVPHQGQFDFAEAAHVNLWVNFANLPVGATIRETMLQPDDTQQYQFEFPLSNHSPSQRTVFYSFPNRFLSPIAGTFKLRLEVENVLVLEAPIDVVETKTPGFDRPPTPIGVAFDPPDPGGNDVLFCRVQGDFVLDDLDWDVVRYHYVWTVNGTEVRNVVTAGRGDAIPRGTATNGSHVECTVTPSDGTLDGAPATASVVWGGNLCGEGDADGDGVCDVDDNCAFTANPGQEDTGGVGSGSPPDGIGDACQCGDVNGDGRVTIADATLITRSLLQPPTATLAKPALCDVGGGPSPATQNCTVTDAVIVRRALLGPPTAVIGHSCAPAQPAGAAAVAAP